MLAKIKTDAKAKVTNLSENEQNVLKVVNLAKTGNVKRMANLYISIKI